MIWFYVAVLSLFAVAVLAFDVAAVLDMRRYSREGRSGRAA